jgi:hypothetical protein
MKKKILLLLSFALILSVDLCAQVTIGGLTTPKPVRSWTGLSSTSNETIITITAETTGVYPADSITVRALSSCGGGTRRANTQVVTISEIPAEPTTPSSAIVTSGDPFTFSASVPCGHAIYWYAAASGGSPIQNGSNTPSVTVNNLTATTTYYAESRNIATGCVSASRLAVTGTVPISDCILGTLTT